MVQTDARPWQALAGMPCPRCLFESPERTAATLGDLVAVCGPGRRAAVTRELTKVYEESLRGTLAELASDGGRRPRGGHRGGAGAEEGGAGGETVDAVDAALDSAMAAGMKPSDAAREVARALGLRRAEVYARALARTRT